MKKPVLFVWILICLICFHVNACDRHKLEEKSSVSSAVTTKNGRNATHNRIRRNQSSDMSPGDVRERCMGSVILALCKAGDPDYEDMMFQWIENSSRKGWGRNPVVIEAIREILARHQQSDIHDILFQERFINLGNDSGGGLAALIAEKDPSLAIQWSMSLKSLRERQEGVVAVLRFHMSHQDDAAAMTTIELVCKEIPRLNLLHEIVRFKAREEPIQAAKWLEDQPDTKYKHELYANLTRIWYDQDGIAASSWVGTLSPGDNRDAAAQALVNEVVKFDIKSAIAWGSEIQNAYMRQQAFRQIARMPSAQIKQTIQTMGHSLKFSKADLNALMSNEETSP